MGAGARNPTDHHAFRFVAMYPVCAPSDFALAKKRSIIFRSDESNTSRSTGRSITRRRIDESSSELPA